jgi:ribosomal protein S18 acetylase RimI-like enzyme
MAPMNESRVTLRMATVDDADAMHAMIQAMAGEAGAAERMISAADDFRRFGFSDPPCFYALMAERGRVAVGLCVYFFSFSTWRGTRGVYIQDIYVAGTERGRGLAQRLIAETARRAGEQGARFLRLSVARENLAARKFYEKLGMKHAADECIYMVLGDDFEALKDLA